MITVDNYFVELERVGVNNLPEVLQESHAYVVDATENGSSWEAYHSSDAIKEVIDIHIQKVNEYVSLKEETTDTSKQPRKEKQPKQKITDSGDKATKPGKRKAKSIKTKPDNNLQKKAKVPSKNVEHIREEVKFIKRFVGIHNKVKSPSTILSFIKALQRAIVQKLIRKTSPFAKDIEMIQDRLINAYNKMKGEQTFEINEKDLNRLVGIAGGEQVYPSITVIKRFIGLQEKNDEDKINAFIKYLENLAKNKKLTKDDPYADKVNEIYKRIRQRDSSKILISEVELNGLEGIVKACSCKEIPSKIYKAKQYTNETGLNGVLTAEEMANRQVDLLNFFSFWLSLFGRPARNFVLMLHGDTHNGKTILLLKFAQYLAENFGNVLYISSEEFASATMTKKVKDLVNPFPKRLHFTENLQDPELSNYDFVILDSVNDLGLKVNEYKEIRKTYPNTAFILVHQHTKAGDYRGGKDWEHTAEIVGEVHKGVVTITKNRYAAKNSLDFFRQFNLQWQEPKQAPTKPLQLRGDMVTNKNTHY